jgi:hypothetical protein
MYGFDNAQPLQGECRVPAGPALLDLVIDHVAARYAGQLAPHACGDGTSAIIGALAASGPAQGHGILVDA